MAEIYPNEGIDYIMAIFPKNGTNLATSYMGLFSSQTASTVPAATAVLSTSTGVTETTGTSYARQSIAAASWGAQAAGSPDGRQSTAGQVTWPSVGSGAWGTVNGFFIASALTTGTAVFYSNFSDTTAIVTAAGDVIKITPTMGIGA